MAVPAVLGLTVTARVPALIEAANGPTSRKTLSLTRVMLPKPGLGLTAPAVVKSPVAGSTILAFAARERVR